jgi:single-strand DNA-binding protein
MRADINRVILSGTLIKNPEIRYNPKGNPVITFTIAFSYLLRKAYNIKGEKSYIDVIALGSSVEKDRNYLQEGKKVLINGRLKQRRWKNPEGISRDKLELVADHIYCIENR